MTSRMTELREIASGLRFPEGPVVLPDGSVLVVEIAAGQLTRIAPDGRKDVVARPGGGPNGAAIGPDGKCYLCNNGGNRWLERDGKLYPGLADDNTYSGGRIERVDLATGAVEVLYTECDGEPLHGPNDLVFDSAGGFWFTDHGKTRRRQRDRGAIYYARADGSFISEAIFPLEAPNGIGLSPAGDRLYVAETDTARLWAFEIEGPGKIGCTRGALPWLRGALIAGLPGYQLFDSLGVEQGGDICVATIGAGGITVISPDGKRIEHVAMPDPLTTNICFGGAGLRTAYITLSSSGRLVAVDWTQPGLPLNY